MAKTLCDWSKKDIEKRANELAALLRDPQFYCRKCARGACTYKVLCEPKKLRPMEGVLEEARRVLEASSR
jgi:hypothetical protein